jgi:hypothetical protein
MAVGTVPEVWPVPEVELLVLLELHADAMITVATSTPMTAIRTRGVLVGTTTFPL